jgi:hypothetical protein
VRGGWRLEYDLLELAKLVVACEAAADASLELNSRRSAFRGAWPALCQFHFGNVCYKLSTVAKDHGSPNCAAVNRFYMCQLSCARS